MVAVLANRWLYWGVDLPLNLPPGLPELSEQQSVSMNLKSVFWGGRSATWSATWSAWALRAKISQYESKISVSWGVDLLLDLLPGLPELSEQQSISMNLKSAFLFITMGGRSATWSATWSAWALQSNNLSVWICKCTVFWGGDLPLDLPTWSAWDQSEVNNLLSLDHLKCTVFGRGEICHLICHLVCLSSQSNNLSVWNLKSAFQFITMNVKLSFSGG